MNPKPQPSSRTAEIWTRFVGMFGGEAVARKYGDQPPGEWVGMVGQMSDFQLERGMRRLVHSGRANVPSLPEFLKLCRTISNDEEFEKPQIALPAPDQFQGDAWDTAANSHLLAHIAERLAKDPHCYGRGASYRVMRVSRSKTADASPGFIASVATLADAKRRWATDMRDIARAGEVPVEQQRAIWADYIGCAEALISKATAAA